MSKLLSILVYLRRQKIGTDGQVPIYVRLTVDGDQDEFSLSRKILPEEWDVKKQQVLSKSLEARITNTKITQMKGDFNKLFLKIPTDERVTAEQLKKMYFRIPPEKEDGQIRKDPEFSQKVMSLIAQFKSLAKKKKSVLKRTNNLPQLMQIESQEQDLLAEIEATILQTNQWMDGPTLLLSTGIIWE